MKSIKLWFDIVKSWFAKEEKRVNNSGVSVGISDKIISIQEIDEVGGMVTDWYNDVGARAGFKN